MKIVYKTFKAPKNLQKACNLGQAHKLHNSMYSGLVYFYSCMKNLPRTVDTVACIVVAYDADLNNKPIGICVNTRELEFSGIWDVAVYVKDEYRKKGIGTALFKKAKAVRPIKSPCMTNPTNRGFYHSLGF